jgi:hypothetical protein
MIIGRVFPDDEENMIESRHSLLAGVLCDGGRGSDQEAD